MRIHFLSLFGRSTGMGSRRFWWMIALFIGFYFQAQLLNSQNLTCNQNDLDALQGFLNGLVFNNLGSGIDGWNISNNCCNWVGITCNSSSSLGLQDGNATIVASGRVTRLILDRRRLTGKISESLGNLDQLRFVNLSHNILTGSLPVSLFHLPNLQVLDLGSNDLYGPLPQSINLPSVQILDVSSNSLNGSIPTHVCENTTQIQVLSLAVNYFSGGMLPGLGNCDDLEELYLGKNDLTGGIAEDIFHLQRLSVLSLHDNKFSGQLSSDIGNLSSLVRLDISTNNFAGMIPDVFDKLSKFQYLVAHSNNFSGRIPFSVSNSPTLNALHLSDNSLEGVLDLNCTVMTSLASLGLGSNRFNGSLPDNLPLCRRLKNIDLARNNFKSEIPPGFGNFESLSYLSLSNCSLVNLYSCLQILQENRNLATLVLTMNFHDEELPADPNLHFKNLEILIIANCRLTGSIPQWLRGCTKLKFLDLSWNRLGGTIPAWFGSFKDLFYLDLSNNTLTGEIPKNITALPSLINRNISLEDPSDFDFVWKSNSSARGLRYKQVSSFPPTLRLSRNFLNGSLWPEFGDLKDLHVLSLENNSLSGRIPRELSGITSLEFLDLSHNNLSGTIPSSLEKLSFLSLFSVAFNQLYGKIPLGGQFLSFPNSSFEGNNLCGDYWFFCPKNDRVGQIPLEAPKEPIINKEGIIIGTVFGIVFGIALESVFSQEMILSSSG